MKINKQYNNFAKDFSDSVSLPLISRNVFYKILGKDLSEKKLLDVACGDGTDLVYYRKKGATVSGIDSSEELINIGIKKIPDSDLRVGLMENLPFKECTFDIVLSKYAIQTSENLETSIMELIRVAKRGGTIMFLATHPLRQFLEKKQKFKDYYKKEKVDSVLFKGDIVAQEFSHTFSEYLSEKVLKEVRLVSVFEGSDFSDTSAQQVGGDFYPTFIIFKFIKI